MVIVVGNGPYKQSSNPSEAFSLSLNADTLRKSMNPSIVNLTHGK